jgi:3-hydroxyacyl-CoA dehydrogenase/enoyl-CoA hydratase/3-hydroxybutyryl-CoA epimerase
MKSFTLETAVDGIACLKIDVPKETMNTLRADFIGDVEAILNQVENDKAIQGLVIYSGKPDSFIAGADINMINDCKKATDATKIARDAQKLFGRIAQLNIPVVAAIHGVCLGGGLELALACHFRVCTDHTKTQLGLPEVQLGLLPGGGGTQRLPQLIGIKSALTMMLTGRQIRSKQALKMGLVDDVVPSSILMQVARKWAQGCYQRKPVKQNIMLDLVESTSLGTAFICQQALKEVLAKTNGNYPAPAKIIECVRMSQSNFGKGNYDIEAQHFGDLAVTPESAALRSIFFATTQMKKETGAGKTKPKSLAQVAVVGSGLMGSGIAAVTAMNAKIPVTVKGIDQAGLNQAWAYIGGLLKQKLKRKRITPLTYQRLLSKFSTTFDYVGLEQVDVVVEAVFEDLELKHSIVHEVEKHTHKDTIFATNTSSLPIADIAKVAKRPENLVGLHYFSPVDKMPLVEVIAHKKTSAATIATVVDLARRQGKTPIVVQDGAGFYVNRILALYMSEAAQLLLEGVAVDSLDRAVVKFGFPLGPMQLLDEVGIDVGTKIVPILCDKLGDRFHVPDIFDRLHQDQRLGKKNQRGFYVYPAKKKGKEVDISIYRALGLSQVTKALPADGIERCVLQMLNEAARCLEEKIIASPRDGDIGAIYGIGFPPFLGGPFHYMDRLGIPNVVGRMEKLAVAYGERLLPCQLLINMAKKQQNFY